MMLLTAGLNTYNGHKYGPGTHMYDWLEETLKNVDRSVTPWVVVGMHAPWYNTNSGHTYDPVSGEARYGMNEVDTVQMAENFEPLFNEYKVNLVFSGHVHAYERFHPTGVNASCDNGDSSGPTYVTVGDAGNHEGLYLPEILTNFYQLKCSAYRNNEYYGFGFLKVHNESVAEWVWMPNPQGSERLPPDQWGTNYTKVSRMMQGYVDQAFITNYALVSSNDDNSNSNAQPSLQEEESAPSGGAFFGPAVSSIISLALLWFVW